MNVSPVASSEKVQSALTNLGIPDGFVAYDVVPLLQQLVVALGNVTGGGGGGSAVWGDITGTLSNQTDLQNALDAKSNIINVPRVIYVSTFGNDTTGNGSLSKPFLTVDHAVNQVTGPTRIVLAGGDYTVDANAVNLFGYPIEIVGQGGVGFNRASSDLAVTKLVISGVGANGTNSAGAGGAPVYLTASQIYLEINSYGGNVDADDGSTYSAGSGGNVHIEGDCDVVINNYGGSAGTLSNDSVVNGGNGGAVTLGWGVRIAAPIGTTAMIYSVAGTGGGGGGDGTAGDLIADDCDLRSASISAGTITLGRCSYTNGLAINNDKGGNASW